MYPFDHRYPGTDLHEIDLAYVITQVQAVTEKVRTLYENGTIKFADPVEWSITKNYTAGTIVKDATTSQYYISKDLVPAGIQLYNTEYWQALGLMENADYSGEIARLDAAIAAVNTTATNAAAAAATADTKATAAGTAAANAATAAAAAQQAADGVASTAAGALSVAQAANTTANAASQAAQTAQTTAEGIDGKATTALSTANSAAEDAADALAAAQSVEGTASSALTTAQSANSTAQAANTTAQAAQSAAAAAQTTANNKVSKTGDTMTGILTMENKNVDIKTPGITDGTNPASAVTGTGVVFQDSADVAIGQLRPRKEADGLLMMRLIASNQGVANELRVGVYNDGTKYAYVTDPAPWKEALGFLDSSDMTTINANIASAIAHRAEWIPDTTITTLTALINLMSAAAYSDGQPVIICFNQATTNTLFGQNYPSVGIFRKVASNRIDYFLTSRQFPIIGFVNVSTRTVYRYPIATEQYTTYAEA